MNFLFKLIQVSKLSPKEIFRIIEIILSTTSISASNYWS